MMMHLVVTIAGAAYLAKLFMALLARMERS